MVTTFDYKKGFTHAGKFHADDVFATALLRILNPDITIIRGFRIPEGFDGIVYDIGMGEFDHHQKDKRIREDGTPYAAFGLLWEQFGSLLLEEKQAKEIEYEYVRPIDLCDNSPEKNPLTTAISWMNPAYDEPDEMENCFWKAVDLAQTILAAAIKKLKKEAEAEAKVHAAMEKSDGKVLVLESFLPWKDAVKGSDILFVIFPSLRGGYNICSVPSETDPTAQKIRFPQKLGGITPEELTEITGIEGFQFCHPGGFLCATDTLEAAKQLADWTEKDAGIQK